MCRGRATTRTDGLNGCQRHPRAAADRLNWPDRHARKHVRAVCLRQLAPVRRLPIVAVPALRSLVCVVLLASCTEEGDANPWHDGGIEAGPSSDADDSTRLDVGGADTSSNLGCSGIDFLFVIDNSLSMADVQERLLLSFPGFIDAIEATSEGAERFHVGVVTSDVYQHNSNVPFCRQIGALVTSTGGKNSFGRVCGFDDSRRYLTPEDNLDYFFPCIAQVGTDGYELEQPLRATAEAVKPEVLQAGACNEGFLRDDAILVVVILTDDPPHASDLDDAHPDRAEMIPIWRDALVQAKHGHEEAVVVIGFVPYGNVACIQPQRESPNLIEFVSSFGERGVLQSVCQTDYSDAFASVVSTIDATCQAFTPPG
jgi:hypothetical protein